MSTVKAVYEHLHRWPHKNGTHLTPGSAEQVAQILKDASDRQTPLALSEQTAGLLENPLWLDLSGLNAIRRYPADDFMITVETGITMEALARTAAPQQQEFALRYLPEAVLWEVLGDDRSSLESGSRGYPRDYVLKCEIATPDGLLAISGADVVKNATGYDLNKLYVGSGHTLGVITAVTLKLVPHHTEKLVWLGEFDTLAEAAEQLNALKPFPLPFTVMELALSPRLKKGRRKGSWHVLLQLEGGALFLEEAKTILNREAEGFKPVKGGQGHTHWSTLAAWPEDAVVFEAALPVGQWLPAATEILEAESQGWLVQIRPAAGLVYVAWPISETDQENQANRIRAIAERHLGFVQCVQAPPSLWQMMSRYNLPEDPATRMLTQTLKNGYDPQGILFNPRYSWKAMIQTP